MEKNSNLNQFCLPRWDELPSIDLYLEQVLSLLEEWLGDFLSNGSRKIMTKTMVNNYVKQKFIRHPVHKKYDRISVASLFIIAVLKPVYSINEISKLIGQALDASSDHPEISYNRFCQITEEAVEHAFNGTSMPKNNNPGDPRDLFWNVCNSFACQLYVKKKYLEVDS